MKPCAISQVRRLAFLLPLLLGVANAQLYETEGVVTETDSFTGETSCRQSVATSDMSLTLANVDGSYQLTLTRFELFPEDVAHNLYGAFDGDEMLFLIEALGIGDDEVFSYPLADATADVTQDYDGNVVWDSEITMQVDQPFMERLLDRYRDVEYRISANGEEYDGTLSSSLLNTFPPFRNECF